MSRDKLATIGHYHDETKHGFRRYARSPGYMDWPNQPHAFRRYEGAEVIDLERPAAKAGPTWAALKHAERDPAPMTLATMGDLFFHSLALSAWKQVVDPAGRVVSRWSLRVNPSSGNLHPTECYLIGGIGDELSPGVFHYAPDVHGLERRGDLAPAAWDAVQRPLPGGALLLALTSVQWREIWKYGERAYRYCQHDVGHALAALGLAAARLGWQVRLLPHPGTGLMGRLLGIDQHSGPEAEHADCLLAVVPGTDTPKPLDPVRIAELGATTAWHGSPNHLSPEHRHWAIIDEVNAATRIVGDDDGGEVPAFLAGPPPAPTTNGADLSAADVILRRRSAQAMDPRADLDADTFARLLRGLLPGTNRALASLPPWPPRVSLAFFVHRVTGLERGLYLLARSPAHAEALRTACDPRFEWQRPEGWSDELPFYRLRSGDVRQPAKVLSCNQDIAGDGIFSLGMLADFDATLSARGPAAYPQLFWETGMVGQLLYLEAEAAGLQGTGIGCFLDDEVHRLLGLTDHAWQSLYHFTVGRAVHDDRLQTVAAYAHLDGDPQAGD